MFSKTMLSFAAFVAAFGAVNALSGEATFYDPAGGFGACGGSIPDSTLAVALSAEQYAGGANCGKTVSVDFEGKNVEAVVMDLCPGCSANSLDLTRTAFSLIANQDLGRINIEWSYL